MTKIELGDKDAAIVFNEKGESELYIPEQKDDELVLPSSLQALRVVMALEDERVVEFIDKVLEEDGVRL